MGMKCCHCQRCVRLSIFPFPFMICYQSHTVCLHLLVVDCNNSLSVCVFFPHFFSFFKWWSCFDVVLLIIFVSCILCKVSVGWSSVSFHQYVACFNYWISFSSFVLFCFEHDVPNLLKYKEFQLSRASSDLSFIHKFWQGVYLFIFNYSCTFVTIALCSLISRISSTSLCFLFFLLSF